jgi:hypothetical protein
MWRKRTSLLVSAPTTGSNHGQPTCARRPSGIPSSDTVVLVYLASGQPSASSLSSATKDPRERSWRLKCSVLVKLRPQILHVLNTIVTHRRLLRCHGPMRGLPCSDRLEEIQSCQSLKDATKLLLELVRLIRRVRARPRSGCGIAEELEQATPCKL